MFSGKAYQVEENDHGFVKTFSSYEDAANYGKKLGITDYKIFGLCTAERNHII